MLAERGGVDQQPISELVLYRQSPTSLAFTDVNGRLVMLRTSCAAILVFMPETTSAQ